MASQPSSYLNWIPGGTGASGSDGYYMVPPSSGQRTTGWVMLESPPFQYMNWLFYMTDQWIQFLAPSIVTGAPAIPATPISATFTGYVQGTNVISSISGVTGTISSISQIQPGMAITGNYIPSGTYVLSVNVGVNSIAISQNATSTATETLTLSPTFAKGTKIQDQLNQLDEAIVNEIAAVADFNPVNKVVDAFNYPNLAAALASAVAGDTILVKTNQTSNVDLTCSVNDVGIICLSDVSITFTSGATFGLKLSAGNSFDGTLISSASMTSLLNIQGSNCAVTAKMQSTSGTATYGILVSSGGQSHITADFSGAGSFTYQSEDSSGTGTNIILTTPFTNYYTQTVSGAVSIVSGAWSSCGCSPVTLGPGSWDVQAYVFANAYGATAYASVQLDVSTDNSASSSGVLGYMFAQAQPVTPSASFSLLTGLYRVTVPQGSTQNYYPKLYSQDMGSLATESNIRITARAVRY